MNADAGVAVVTFPLLAAGAGPQVWRADHPGEVANLRVDRRGGEGGPLSIALSINDVPQPRARVSLPGAGFRVAMLPEGTQVFAAGDRLGCVVEGDGAGDPDAGLTATVIVRMRVAAAPASEGG